MFILVVSSSPLWLKCLALKRRETREKAEGKTDSGDEQHTHEGKQRKAEEVHCDCEIARTFVLWFLLMVASCK